MSYIGKTPLVGNYQICDALTASATADYTLQVGSVNVSPQSANAMIVSLNGVIQGPGASRGFTVSGSTISFNSALTTSDVIDFIYIFGDVLDIGTPTDDSVSAAKLTADAVTTAKILDNNVTLAKLDDGTQGDVLYYGASGAPARLGFGTSGDFLKTQGTGANPVWATAGGGKIGQVLQAVTTDTATYGTQTYADITGLTIDITPAATSSKILVMTDVLLSITSGYGGCIRLMRDSTAIYLGTAAGNRPASSKSTISRVSSQPFSLPAMYLDSPSTTSATTYKVQWLTETASTIYRGRSVNDGDDAFRGRTADSITVMEVLA